MRFCMQWLTTEADPHRVIQTSGYSVLNAEDAKDAREGHGRPLGSPWFVG